jgi:hypothetical protein
LHDNIRNFLVYNRLERIWSLGAGEGVRRGSGAWGESPANVVTQASRPVS